MMSRPCCMKAGTPSTSSRPTTLPYFQQKQVGLEFAEVASMGMELLALAVPVHGRAASIPRPTPPAPSLRTWRRPSASGLTWQWWMPSSTGYTSTRRRPASPPAAMPAGPSCGTASCPAWIGAGWKTRKPPAGSASRTFTRCRFTILNTDWRSWARCRSGATALVDQAGAVRALPPGAGAGRHSCACPTYTAAAGRQAGLRRRALAGDRLA